MTQINYRYRRLSQRLKPALSTRSDHYVCFGCRKQFQKPAAYKYGRVAGGSQILALGQNEDRVVYQCPQCGKEMRLIGKNFRAPKQDDVEGWEVARRLLDAGFHYWGWEGQLPTHLRDVQAFIAKNRPKSAGERMLEKWEANQ